MAENYIATLEKFCKSFGSYVTGNWRQNHLMIYIHLYEKPLTIACYGLGKVNWSGKPEEGKEYNKILTELLPLIPDGIEEVKVQYNCGKICKIELMRD